MEALTRDQVVERARNAAQIRSVKYRLGGGKMIPIGAEPLDEQRSSDCSAFAMWCLGESKISRFAWLVKFNGGWYSTDGIVFDALNKSTGIFDRVERCEPGDLIVYPGVHTVARHMPEVKGDAIAKLPKIGHVGVVTQVGPQGQPTHAVHCSKGNEVQKGTAIMETETHLWLRHPATIYARCTTVGE